MKDKLKTTLNYLGFLALLIPILLYICVVIVLLTPKYYQAYSEYGIEFPWFLNKTMIGFDLFFIPLLILFVVALLLFEFLYRKKHKRTVRNSFFYSAIFIANIFLCFISFLIAATFMGYIKHVTGRPPNLNQASIDNFANTTEKISIKEYPDPEHDNRKKIDIYRGDNLIAKFTEVDKDLDDKYEISFGWYAVNGRNVFLTTSLDNTQKFSFQSLSYADVVVMKGVASSGVDQLSIISKAHDFFELFNKKENGTFLPASESEREVRKKEFTETWKFIKSMSELSED